jgi:hypothetical protein
MRATFAIPAAMFAILQSPAIRAEPASPTLLVGVDGEVLPVVGNHISMPEFEGEPDAGGYGFAGSTAYAVGALVEWNAMEHFALAFAPRYIVGLTGFGDDILSMTQLDLRIRIAVGGQLTRRLRLYAFASPGYLVPFLAQRPDFYSNPDAHGAFGLEAGIGARFTISRHVAATAEVSYQLTSSFGKVEQDVYGDEMDFSEDFVAVSLGFVTPAL